MEATFEQLLVKREKEESKKRITILGSIGFRKILSFAGKRIKKYQFRSKIRGLKSDLKRTKKLFSKSLTDPTIDSIELGVRAMRIERELKTIKEIYRTVYYNKILLFFIKLFTKKPKK